LRPGKNASSACSSSAAEPKVPVESVDKNQTLGAAADRPWVAGVSPEDQAEALRHFREGNALLNDGVFVTAAKRYRDALAHWDHPAIHYNLALAMMNLDQPIDVYQSLTKALKYNPKDGPAPLDEDKYDRAKNYMLLAQKQVANVDISCDKPGAKVAVDGEVVFTGPGRYQGLVRVGKHSFVAEKAGYVTSVEAPYIGPGETMRFSLKLYSAEELTRHRRRWQRTWVPWAVVGGGGALAIASSFIYVSGRSEVRDFDARISKCGAAGCPITPELTDMRDSGTSKQTLAWVGFGLGAGTIATGLVLAYANRVRPYQIRPEDLPKEGGGPTAASLSLRPMIGPGLAGAAASFRF
ncbi:MAG TPA: PEGA domain-containing protein, partial [Kofleriaceae bacterium]|nr:PEGA domain-containing protein [Kofleriaceae bacterium]